MKRSYLIATLLLLASIGWLASGELGWGDAETELRKPAADLGERELIPAVRVRQQRAEPHALVHLIRGHSEAKRKVELRAETHGRIAELLVARGAAVEAGALLARIEPQDRPARLAQARALRSQREIEFRAAQTLAGKGFRAETQVAAAKAALEEADAAVTLAEVELANLEIRAPFAGRIDEAIRKAGDYLQAGDPLLRLVELDPILLVGQASERDVAGLKLGQAAEARLSDGRILRGRLTFRSQVAEPQTRTFRVEVTVANPDEEVADGLTAELRLPLGTVMAQRVTPAVLTLDDGGRVGVKVVDAEQRVRFMPVEMIDSNAHSVWLTGLPESARLITVGHEFVQDGQQVRALEEQARGKAGAPQTAPAGGS